MDYNDVLGYINKIKDCGIVPGLDNITRLCERLGNPQDKLRFVHIAGTNGKGSVLAFVSSCLNHGGYKVGMYISPTLFEYRERIQVNGIYIPVGDLCEGMEIVKKACDEIVNEGFCQPTPFEVETALAFWYFEKEKCDIVVLETGMGGALDATNLIKNTLVAVITSVGFDHMSFLGDTLSEIAKQKAGIIKRGCSVVAMLQSDEVLDIVRGVAMEKGCKFVVSDISDEACKTKIKNGKGISGRLGNYGGTINSYDNKMPCEGKKLSGIKYGLDKQYFNYGNIKKLEILLCGKFQIDNAVLALNVIDELKEHGFVLSEHAIREGLWKTRWRGRFQVLGCTPYFIVDGAHNEDAAKKLIDTLELYFTNKRFIYIMGMLRDKECEEVVSITACYADKIITVTPPDNPRAMKADELAVNIKKIVAEGDLGGNSVFKPDGSTEYSGKSGLDSFVEAADSVEGAVELALKEAKTEDVIIAFGSLSFLGEIIDKLKI